MQRTLARLCLRVTCLPKHSCCATAHRRASANVCLPLAVAPTKICTSQPTPARCTHNSNAPMHTQYARTVGRGPPSLLTPLRSSRGACTRALYTRTCHVCCHVRDHHNARGFCDVMWLVGSAECVPFALWAREWLTVNGDAPNKQARHPMARPLIVHPMADP
jgi:hypothetical protein